MSSFRGEVLPRCYGTFTLQLPMCKIRDEHVGTLCFRVGFIIKINQFR